MKKNKAFIQHALPKKQRPAPFMELRLLLQGKHPDLATDLPWYWRYKFYRALLSMLFFFSIGPLFVLIFVAHWELPFPLFLAVAAGLLLSWFKFVIGAMLVWFKLAVFIYLKNKPARELERDHPYLDNYYMTKIRLLLNFGLIPFFVLMIEHPQQEFSRGFLLFFGLYFCFDFYMYVNDMYRLFMKINTNDERMESLSSCKQDEVKISHKP